MGQPFSTASPPSDLLLSSLVCYHSPAMQPSTAALITLEDSDSDIELLDVSWLAADKHVAKAEPKVGIKRPREDEPGPSYEPQSGTWQPQLGPEESAARPATAALQPALKPEVKPDIKPQIKPDPYQTPGRQRQDGLTGRPHSRHEVQSPFELLAGCDRL